MTQSLALINNGIAYGTGNVLPAATINSGTANEQLAYAIGLSRQSPAVIPSASEASFAVFSGTVLAVTALSSAAPYSHFVIEIYPNGQTTYWSSAGLPDGVSVLTGYNAGAPAWDAMRIDSEAASLYVSADELMDSWTTHTLSSAITPRGYYARTATSRFFCGALSGSGRIIEIDTTNIIRSNTNASTAMLSSIVGNGTTGLVAVGIGGVSWSTDSGATWNTASLTTPATAVGLPYVTWDASRSVYVATVVLSSGAVAWSTSSTGASWQAWRRTTFSAIDASMLGPISTEQCGLAVFGSTWVIPRVVGNPNHNYAALAISLDAGGTWRALGGGEKLPTYNFLRCLPCYGRIAIVASGGVVLCGDATADDLTNSAAI